MAHGVPIDVEKLRRARLRKGWTTRDISGRCAELGTPVPYGTYAYYERGAALPPPRRLLVIAQALEVEVDDLLLPARGNGSAA